MTTTKGLTLSLKGKTGRQSRPFLLTLIFSMIVLVLGAFLQEDIALFNTEYYSLFSSREFFVFFFANVLLLAFYFIFIHRHFEIRFSPIIAIGLFILFLGNTIALYHFPDSVSGHTDCVWFSLEPFDWTHTISSMDRLRDTLSFLIGCIDLYILFAVLPKVLRSPRSVIWVWYLGVVIALIAVIYSFIAEADVYGRFFDSSHPIDFYADSIVSFLRNRNTYATMLLLGIVCTGIIHSDSPHFWNYLLMGLFFAAMFFTASKMGIIVTAVYFVLFAITRFVRNLRNHKVMAWSGAALFVVSISVFFCLGQFQLLPETTLFSRVYRNFMDSIVHRYEYGFLDNRLEIWGFCLNYISSDIVSLIFGVGETNALVFLKEVFNCEEYFYSVHNGFLHQLFAGGVLRLALYSALVIGVVVVFILNARKGRRTSGALFVGFIAFLLHGIMETTAFLAVDSKGLGITLVCVVPLICGLYQDTHEEAKLESDYLYSNVRKSGFFKTDGFTLALSSSYIWLPVSFFFLAVVPLLSKLSLGWLAQFDNPIFMTMGIVLLIMPVLSFFFASSYKNSGTLALTIITHVILLGMVVVTIIFQSIVVVVVAIILLALLDILTLLINFKRMDLSYFKGLIRLLIPIVFISLIFLGSHHLFTFVFINNLPLGLASLNGVPGYDTPTLNIFFIVLDLALYAFLAYGILPLPYSSFPLHHLLARADMGLSYLGKHAEDIADSRVYEDF